ncbi:hypothetical protein D3C84_752540 [compost metagenome]
MDIAQRLLGEHALVGGVQFEELAPRMGHAADLDHTEFEARLITTKIITNQLAPPVLQEVASMLTGAAGAEVVDDSGCFAELAGGVGPNIRTVGFL